MKPVTPAELRGIAERLLEIAGILEAQEQDHQIRENARLLADRDPVKVDRGAIKVTLPDLFSMLDSGEVQSVEQTTDPDGITTIVDGQPVEIIPTARKYSRVGCKMKDDVIIAADNMKIGRATGYCQRSDIERSLRRLNPEAGRETIREAVNAAVAELGLLCITHSSYRYYRSVDRPRIIERATAKLCA